MEFIYPIGSTPLELDEIAVRFHHRLVYIHAFVNGNGRHARVATNFLVDFGSLLCSYCAGFL